MFVVGALYLLLMVSFAVPSLFAVTIPVYYLVGRQALRRRRTTVAERRQQRERLQLDAMRRYFS